MKKLMLSVAFLATTLCVSAQTLVKPDFKKGDVAHYEDVSTMQLNIPMGGGTQLVKAKAHATITVKDVNAEGFLLEDITSKIETEGETTLADNLVGPAKYLVDTPVLFQTDKNGKLIKIVNYTEVAAKISKGAIAEIDKLYKENPEMESKLPKAKLIMALSTKFSEENLLKTFMQSGAYAIYGKTFGNGTKENRELNSIKTTTVWNLSSILGTTAIVGKSKANMNEEDTKAYIINMLKEQGLDDAAIQQMNDNWSQLKQMGMDKIDLDMVETVHLSPKMWVTDYETKGKMTVMGSEMEITSNTKLVEK